MSVERQRQEDLLLLLAEVFRATEEVAVVVEAGRVRWLSPAAEARFGRVSAEAEGLPLEELLGPDALDGELARALEQARQAGRAEASVRVPAGDTRTTCDVTVRRLGPPDDPRLVLLCRERPPSLDTSREELLAIVRTIPQPVAVLDRDQRFLAASASLAAVLGRRPAEVVGKRLGDAFPIVGPVVEPHVLAVLEGRGGASIEFDAPLSFDAPDDVRAWRVGLHPTSPPGTRPDSVIVVAEDVTAVRQKERQQRFLADLTERLRLARTEAEVLEAALQKVREHLDADFASYADVDAAEDTLWIRAWEPTPAPVPLDTPTPISRFAPPELLRGPLGGHDLVATDVPTDPRLTSVAGAFETLGIRAFVTVPCTREGELVGTLTVSSRQPRAWRAHERALIEEVGNRLWNALASVRAWKRVTASEERLRTITDAVPALILFVDPDRVLRYINAPDRLWGGTRRGALIGRRIEEVFAPIHARVARHVRRALAGRRVRFELDNLDLEGGTARPLSALVDLVPHVGRDGHVDGFYALATDITDRRTAERALEESRIELARFASDLEQRVRERTEQVRALSAALTLAEQRERRRLSQVLHDDLQQLLFGLSIRLQVLHRKLRDHPDPSTIEGLRTSLELVKKCVSVTRSLSIELDPPTLREQGVDVALTWLAKHMGETHGLEVELRLDEDLPVPGIDERGLVVQLVRELLFNVVKHAGVLRACVAARRENGDLVVIVSDEGRGFDIAQARRDHAQRDKMGLFSVEERLRLHGGSLRIEGGPGRGTRLILRLPVRS